MWRTGVAAHIACDNTSSSVYFSASFISSHANAQARDPEALAARVREQAILIHVVYDGKRAVVADEAEEEGLSEVELEASLQLPSAVLRRCVATAARVVKRYLAHELPAKYQH